MLMCTEKNFVIMSGVLFTETKYFMTGFVLVFIMHVGSFLHMVVDTITVWYIIFESDHSRESD
jgi:hypothetical protein